MVKKVYLDNHTATRPLPSAIDKMIPFYKEYWGSLSSPHLMGQELYPTANECLEILYQAVGARKEDSFLLTSSAKEAISHVFLSTYIDTVRETGRNHFLTVNGEEAATVHSLKTMEKMGCSGKMIALNSQGQLSKDALLEAIKPRTSLLSLSWANGLTGVIQPMEDIAAVCKEKEIKLHVDATYVLGKLFWRFEDIAVDFLSIEGERLHSPKGTAGLFTKGKNLSLSSGTSLNVPAAVALSTAIESVVFYFDHLCTETVRLRDKLEKGILEGFSDAKVFFQEAERLPNCTAIGFPGVCCESLLYLLNSQGVYASLGGGHCQKLSHVLAACGIEKELCNSSLNFSLSYETKEEDIDHAVEVIVSSAKKLQKMSSQLL